MKEIFNLLREYNKKEGNPTGCLTIFDDETGNYAKDSNEEPEFDFETIEELKNTLKDALGKPVFLLTTDDEMDISQNLETGRSITKVYVVSTDKGRGGIEYMKVTGDIIRKYHKVYYYEDNALTYLEERDWEPNIAYWIKTNTDGKPFLCPSAKNYKEFSSGNMLIKTDQYQKYQEGIVPFT